MTQRQDEELAKDGFTVIHRALPLEVVDRANRLLHLEIVNWGLSKEQFDEWHYSKTWFPTLRNRAEILNLAEYIPERFRQGQICEPQILFHFPDEAEKWDLHPHLDQEPPWAEGRSYTYICGVALSPNYSKNGGLMAWPFSGTDQEPSGDPISTSLQKGDIIVFHPKLWHSGGLNRTGEVRRMVYFRYLEE